MREAEIKIDGKVLSFNEAMTLRCALNQFLFDLADKEFAEALGDIGVGYKRNAQALLIRMSEAAGNMTALTFGE